MKLSDLALARLAALEPRTRLAALSAAGATVALLVAADAAGAAIAVVAGILAASLAAAATPLAAVTLLLVWIAVQNLVAPLLLTVVGLGVGDTRAIIGTKELVAASLFSLLSLATVLSRRVTLAGCDKLWLAYSAWVLLYAVNPLAIGAGPFYLAVSLRALLVPVLFYGLGRAVSLSDRAKAVSALPATVLAIGVVAAGFGMIEVLLLGDDFWRGLDIKRYWVEVKGFSPLTIVQDLPASFYGQYGLVYELGRGVRRMASVYGDPLAAGYNLFFAALLSFAGFRHGPDRFRASYAIGFAFLTAALSLTVSRVALAALALSCGVLLFRERLLWRARSLLALGAVALSLLLVFRRALAPAFVSAITMEDPSTRSHLLDLARGLQQLATPRALLGFGLGTAGAPAAASEVHIGITESAYLVLLAQVGIGGLVLFVSALISTYRYLARCERADSRVPFLIPAASAALVGYALTGLVSEQIFTTTSLAAFWTLLGVAVTWCVEGARSESVGP